MKKLLAMAMVAMTGAVLADAANVLVKFSTQGPDKYADGETVTEGECYALVYVKGTFGGVTAEGKAADADDTVLLVASRAKGGRCPTTVFQVDSGVAAGLTGGNYEVVMLDTRTADGTLAKIDATTGLPTAVAAVTEVASYSAGSFDTTATRATTAAAANAAVASAVPADAPKPTVKSIEIKGDKVYITVENTIPALQYNVAGGDDPAALTDKVGTAAQGAATTTEEITIVAPKKAGAQFFKVQRN